MYLGFPALGWILQWSGLLHGMRSWKWRGLGVRYDLGTPEMAGMWEGRTLHRMVLMWHSCVTPNFPYVEWVWKSPHATRMNWESTGELAMAGTYGGESGLVSEGYRKGHPGKRCREEWVKPWKAHRARENQGGARETGEKTDHRVCKPWTSAVDVKGSQHQNHSKHTPEGIATSTQELGHPYKRNSWASQHLFPMLEELHTSPSNHNWWRRISRKTASMGRWNWIGWMFYNMDWTIQNRWYKPEDRENLFFHLYQLSMAMHNFLLLLWSVIKKLWLKQCIFLIFQFWRSQVWHRSHWAKIKTSAGLYSFLEALGENLFPCLFWILDVTHVPWSVAPFLLQNQHVSDSSSIVTSPTDWLGKNF